MIRFIILMNFFCHFLFNSGYCHTESSKDSIIFECGYNYYMDYEYSENYFFVDEFINQLEQKYLTESEIGYIRKADSCFSYLIANPQSKYYQLALFGKGLSLIYQRNYLLAKKYLELVTDKEPSLPYDFTQHSHYIFNNYVLNTSFYLIDLNIILKNRKELKNEIHNMRKKRIRVKCNSESLRFYYLKKNYEAKYLLFQKDTNSAFDLLLPDIFASKYGSNPLLEFTAILLKSMFTQEELFKMYHISFKNLTYNIESKEYFIRFLNRDLIFRFDCTRWDEIPKDESFKCNFFYEYLF